MSSLVILLIAIVVLGGAYLTYGKYLANAWGLDNNKPTPATTMSDGVDYVPAKAPVLMGHHFASIAGAGPINGPIQASVFGWLPVLLWILIGGVFFGAVHDFGSLFASVRHEGKSIGHVIEMNIGRTGKRLFLAFGWFTLLLVIAAFASIVQGTFTVTDEMKAAGNLGNGSVATASLLFIVLAILFGFLVYRKNAPLLVSSVVGIILLGVCIFVGLKAPITFVSSNVWLVFILVYIMVACVTPVWILLQPRDYLNSFLLYAMMLLAVVGVLFTNPTMELSAVTGWKVEGVGTMFPVLFITVACGAISGFHSLVGSGTTSKQIAKESDTKVIGYGAMLIECLLAVLALIAVGALGGQQGTPAVTFATGISGFFSVMGMGEGTVSTIFVIITLAVSAFALTSLDTAARMGRFLFQEFFVNEGEDVKSLTGIRRTLVNPYVATIITVGLGGLLAVGGYQKIWPLFGAANQLLAALALLAVCVWLGRIGKKNFMFYIPMGFMMVATMWSLVLTLRTQIGNIIAPTEKTDMMGAVLQVLFAAVLIILAVILVIEGVKALIDIKNKKVAA
ncbi:carbon starvation protein A [Christensenellaceae bacterium OttesenSCG-928-M15]|nr:carbon starvation protein A [Christensenellaceae bacterium OttesenSCG-928-M15]